MLTFDPVLVVLYKYWVKNETMYFWTVLQVKNCISAVTVQEKLSVFKDTGSICRLSLSLFSLSRRSGLKVEREFSTH